MEIFFPKNIFTHSFISALDEEYKSRIIFKPASMLSKSLNENTDSVALIPTMEILTNKEFFVSKRFGLSYEGPLSNSYIYYPGGSNNIRKIKLSGDVSSMEVILSKILFKELYNMDSEIILQTITEDVPSDPTIIVGDENFVESRYTKGISFAEEVIEVLTAPFVNFILASNNKDLLIESEAQLTEAAGKLDNSYLSGTENFSEESLNFIKENFDKVFFNLDDQDVVGIKELLQLPYYHGLLKDIIEIKFI